MAGSTFKRCGCRDQTTGKPFGRRCPQLRRGDRWNSQHGSWQYQIDLPPAPGGRRRTLRQGPFATQHDAERALRHVEALLQLPDVDDSDGVEQIVHGLQTAVRTKTPLPTVEQVRRRLVAGDAVIELPTVG